MADNARAAKLAMARKMLKSHQEKKHDDENHIEKKSSLNDECANVFESNKIKTEICDISAVAQNNGHHLAHATEGLSHQENNWKMEQLLKAMEVLTINKQQLESQLIYLQNTNTEMQMKYNDSVNTCNNMKEHISILESDLNNVKEHSMYMANELKLKINLLEEQQASIMSLTDKNNNLLEQVDITKTALIAKETENASLQSSLTNLQNRLDLTELRLQQLNHGAPVDTSSLDKSKTLEENAALLQKISTLEHVLKTVQYEKDQMNVHYEQFLSQLNEQVNVLTSKNSALMYENDSLINRESGLIEQIGQMELQLQQFRDTCASKISDLSQPEQSTELEQLQERSKELEKKLIEMQKNYEEAKEQLAQLNKIPAPETSSKSTEMECSHLSHDVNMSKLNADIVSDKLAAQMATAQNRQLKNEVQDLKEAYMKMSQDKLELTEKLGAEKFLNRELTLKLSEIEEQAKETHTKLMAKDEEMIRLLSSKTELERKISRQNTDGEFDRFHHHDTNHDHCDENQDHDHHHHNHDDHCHLLEGDKSLENIRNNEDQILVEAHTQLTDCSSEDTKAFKISVKEAMLKLQERFLRNMKEVAELSDEKHRLEHIIMQLQSETDTICEYVALYQQQRGILKKREEERKEQLDYFEKERDKMKSQLDELSNIISQLANDKDLQQYIQQGLRMEEISKILKLIGNMKSNYLVDTSKQCTDFNSVYPCSWCSGNVITV